MFFPTAEAGPVYEAQIAAAKAICAQCPVRSECLTEAPRIPYGIVGGLTPDERRTRRTATELAAVLEAGLTPGADQAQVAAAGRVLLTAGRPVREVARRCGVSERTVTRWAAARLTSTSSNPTRAGRGAA